MGECGCGEMNVIHNFLIGNKVIVIDLYRGCRDCGANIGIKLHLFTKKAAKEWIDLNQNGKSIEELRPDEFGWTSRDLFWIGMEDIIKAILNYKKELPKYEGLEDFFEELKDDILEDALEFAKQYNKTLNPCP